MYRYPLTVASAALAAGLQLLSSTASAHIELELPMNRYSDARQGDNKSCPCGAGTTNRRCNKPDELSDPDRSEDRVSTFAPGDTITVRFDEYVGHSGRFRIAFDPDGASLDHFNQNILLDEPDPVGKQGNMGQGSIWEFQVTLPDMECENCSLQLIQAMDGNMVDPVLDPVQRPSTYFQCADIRLVEGTPPGGIPPENPSEHIGQVPAPPAAAPAPADSATGAAGAPSTSGRMAVMGTTTATPNSTSVAPAMMDAESSDSSGGCSVGGARPSRGSSALLALSTALVGFGLCSRRRARRQ
ncbi:MAG TPA: SCE4755 family polysaccharide monooxygenase-like protein [Polyangiaceae bacterium]|nr:SCE4755 family polysaccharide monooxygenase-like protein [Polyangiaceae bacterium]